MHRVHPRMPRLRQQEEVETLQQRQAAAAHASRRVAELEVEVRGLQEALADANIVLDKVCARGGHGQETSTRSKMHPCSSPAALPWLRQAVQGAVTR